MVQIGDQITDGVRCGPRLQPGAGDVLKISGLAKFPDISFTPSGGPPHEPTRDGTVINTDSPPPRTDRRKSAFGTKRAIVVAY